MAEQTTVLTTDGLVPEAAPPPVPLARSAPQGSSPRSQAVRTFRLLTANVQSFPRTAITLDQAREDLRANAADGDLVLLQEIDSRYRRIVLEEFPSSEWHVYFGPKENHSPIAARRDLFDVLDQHALLVQPGVPKVNERRYLTHLHLHHRELDLDLHATNVHLVSGAFHKPPPLDAAARQAEWHEGMRKHDRFIAGLLATGAPIVAGGDYNRQLRAFRPMIQALAGGRRLSFGVDLGSIDLIWFVDGTTSMWAEHERTTFRGREGRPRRRNSDHAARQAVLALARVGTGSRPDPVPSPVVIAADGTSTVKDRAKKERKRKKKVASFAPEHHAGQAAGTALPLSTTGFAGPADQPFALTEFGDKNPKKVDWKTRAALEEVERRLGYRLTIVQGCYNNGRVKASGPTHDGGGVVDLLAWDWRRKVRVLREVGFAAWHRPAVPGLWGEHIHAVLIEHGRLDPSAARQVDAYRRGLDGLTSARNDDFPRPRPIPVFSYPPAPTVPAAPTDGVGGRERHVAPLGRAFPPRHLDGVDVSHHQSGRFDLTAARRAGVRWWYVKATEGTTFTDKTYRKRLRQGRRAGIPTGAYHFARPGRGDAEAEARFFLRTIDLRAGDMVPMLDLEDTGGLDLHQLTQWTGVWVRVVTQELQRLGLAGKPVIYTKFDLESGFGCLLWVARYSDDLRPPVIPRPWQRAAIWQHSNGRLGPVKSVPGMGHVDVNALHPDLPLSALRLRPLHRPARPGRARSDRGRADDRRDRPLEPLETAAPAEDQAPATVVQPGVAAAGTPTVTTPPVATPTVITPTVITPTVITPTVITPTVTTTTVAGSPSDPGSIVITVTLPVPAAPAPVRVMPDLSPLEEQLALAARGIQGAIEALPERTEP